MLSEVLSSLALLRSQLSANGPENIFVTFVQRKHSKNQFCNCLYFRFTITAYSVSVNITPDTSASSIPSV